MGFASRPNSGASTVSATSPSGSARKQAAKLDGLNDRQRVLHGYLFALMIKTKKSGYECREILQRIIRETA